MRSLIFSCGLLACAEPHTLDSEPTEAWTLTVSVCMPGAASRCADAEWQTVCGAELVTVPYRECWTPDGDTVEVRYGAEPIESDCDLAGRIADTWDALARGLSTRGCGA